MHKDLTRVERLLREKFPELSRRMVVESLEHALVLSPRGKRLRKGERVERRFPLNVDGLSNHLENLKRGNPLLDFPIVFETDSWLVIDKPAGISSHPVSLLDQNTVSHWAVAKFPEMIAREFGLIQPMVTPHRLDTGTSGALIVAKTKASFEMWRKQFQRKEVTKTYLAWCWGEPSQASYTVETPIAHDLADRRRMRVVTLQGKYRLPVQKARTCFSVVKQVADHFLCEVVCKTGVTHQVRVHLASLGYPLVGDLLYDPTFETRGLRPLFHQLRAMEIQRHEIKIAVDCRSFRQSVPRERTVGASASGDLLPHYNFASDATTATETAGSVSKIETASSAGSSSRPIITLR